MAESAYLGYTGYGPNGYGQAPFQWQSQYPGALQGGGWNPNLSGSYMGTPQMPASFTPTVTGIRTANGMAGSPVATTASPTAAPAPAASGSGSKPADAFGGTAGLVNFFVGQGAGTAQLSAASRLLDQLNENLQPYRDNVYTQEKQLGRLQQKEREGLPPQFEAQLRRLADEQQAITTANLDQLGGMSNMSKMVAMQAGNAARAGLLGDIEANRAAMQTKYGGAVMQKEAERDRSKLDLNAEKARREAAIQQLTQEGIANMFGFGGGAGSLGKIGETIANVEGKNVDKPIAPADKGANDTGGLASGTGFGFGQGMGGGFGLTADTAAQNIAAAQAYGPPRMDIMNAMNPAGPVNWAQQAVANASQPAGKVSISGPAGDLQQMFGAIRQQPTLSPGFTPSIGQLPIPYPTGNPNLPGYPQFGQEYLNQMQQVPGLPYGMAQGGYTQGPPQMAMPMMQQPMQAPMGKDGMKGGKVAATPGKPTDSVRAVVKNKNGAQPVQLDENELVFPKDVSAKMEELVAAIEAEPNSYRQTRMKEKLADLTIANVLKFEKQPELA